MGAYETCYARLRYDPDYPDTAAGLLDLALLIVQDANNALADDAPVDLKSEISEIECELNEIAASMGD